MTYLNRPELKYENKTLCFNKTPLTQFSKIETPFYLYSLDMFKENLENFQRAAQKYFPKNIVCYALKANSHEYFLKTIADLNLGADVVSIGELEFAISCGISPQKIVFSGVGKTKKEITKALEYNIFSFNVESFSELELINSLSKERNLTTRVAIRLNPKVHTLTHHYISTGNKIHKFGIIISEFERIYKENESKFWSNTKLTGLSIHIGSQLTNLEATQMSLTKLASCIEELNLDLEFIDVGGGLGVNYYTDPQITQAPSFDDYMTIVHNSLGDLSKKHTIVFEPGRCIVANCAILVSSVIREKTSEGHNFLIIDAGMNDLMRPCLYQAKHQIAPIKESKQLKVYDIVGPVCESSDSFLSNYEMPECKEDERIIIADTGAYGKTLSSTYNMRELTREYFIEKA